MVRDFNFHAKGILDGWGNNILPIVCYDGGTYSQPPAPPYPLPPISLGLNNAEPRVSPLGHNLRKPLMIIHQL